MLLSANYRFLWIGLFGVSVWTGLATTLSAQSSTSRRQPVPGQVAATDTEQRPPAPAVGAVLTQPNIGVTQGSSSSQGSQTSQGLPTTLRPRIQSGLPAELILPPTSRDAQDRARRFIDDEIDPEIRLSLVTGRPKILRLAETPSRVYVPDNDVLSLDVLDPESGSREIVLRGLQAGTSALTFWFDDPTAPSGKSVVSYLVRVFDDPIFARPIEALSEELNQKFPDSFVELEELGNRLIVRGEARDAIELAQILQILVGARGVRPGAGALNAAQQSTQRIADSLNFVDPNDTAATQLAIAENSRQVDPIALAQAGIINLMRIPGEQQVKLKITVAQVNRSAARSIGINFDIQNSSGTAFGQFSGDILGTTAAAGAGGGAAANLVALLDAGQVSLGIEALRNLSLARTLAEPNLVALNGQTANFQSGGSFPIPVIGSGGVGGGTNLQGVQFVPFGVQLQFTPLIRDRDVIRLQINADVSALDASVGTSIGGGAGGTSVSGISNQSFQTTVQLRSGQTLAVAGLIESSFSSASERVPWWGDLPLIGNTGGSRDTTSSETELVILITPELVAPTSSDQHLALPGDDVYEPSDTEFYLANRLESRRTRDHRSAVRTDFDRQRHGENACLQDYMIGAAGANDRCPPIVSPAHATVSQSGSAGRYQRQPKPQIQPGQLNNRSGASQAPPPPSSAIASPIRQPSNFAPSHFRLRDLP